MHVMHEHVAVLLRRLHADTVLAVARALHAPIALYHMLIAVTATARGAGCASEASVGVLTARDLVCLLASRDGGGGGDGGSRLLKVRHNLLLQSLGKD